MFAEAILSVALAAVTALTPAPTKCPPPEGYPTAGPLGRYVVAATVYDLEQADGMGAVCDDWGFEWYYQDEPDLYDGQRVVLIVDDNDTPDDLLYSCLAGSPCHED